MYILTLFTFSFPSTVIVTVPLNHRNLVVPPISASETEERKEGNKPSTAESLCHVDTLLGRQERKLV